MTLLRADNELWMRYGRWIAYFVVLNTVFFTWLSYDCNYKKRVVVGHWRSSDGCYDRYFYPDGKLVEVYAGDLSKKVELRYSFVALNHLCTRYSDEFYQYPPPHYNRAYEMIVSCRIDDNRMILQGYDDRAWHRAPGETRKQALPDFDTVASAHSIVQRYPRFNQLQPVQADLGVRSPLGNQVWDRPGPGDINYSPHPFQSDAY